MSAADTPVNVLGTEGVRTELVALVNSVRKPPLRPLTENILLFGAGMVHATDMVQNQFWSHTGSDGTNAAQRIARAGYTKRASWWLTGENLAWVTDEYTPRDILNLWLWSPPHLANILRPGFREIGMAVVIGTPTGAVGGMTIACEFGHVKAKAAKRKRKRKKRKGAKA